MPTDLTRRELLAWLAAGAAGTALALDRATGSGPGGSGPDSPDTSRPPGGDPAAANTDPTRPASSPASSPASQASEASRAVAGERLLVVIEMAGGNDGLSMVVPHQNGAYYDARPETAIDPADALDLDGRFGLHPNLGEQHRRGITVVHGVGSAEPDGSHFEMQQRWWAGNSLDDGGRSAGWLGRVADQLAPEAGVMRAVSITPGSHPIVRSDRNSTMSIPSLDAIRTVTAADDDDRMAAAYQQALRDLTAGAVGDLRDAPAVARQQGLLGSTIDFAARLLDADRDDDIEAAGYTWSGFQQGLWLAAAILGGDTGIRIVHVEVDGDFDTHRGHTWRHPDLMAELDAGLAAFRDDLERRGLTERTMVITTSEFGRTIEENSSAGLDHGTASSALVVHPGADSIVGDAPSLTRLDANGDQIAGIALESYLAGACEHWLGVPSEEVFGSPVDALTVA